MSVLLAAITACGTSGSGTGAQSPAGAGAGGIADSGGGAAGAPTASGGTPSGGAASGGMPSGGSASGGMPSGGDTNGEAGLTSLGGMPVVVCSATPDPAPAATWVNATGNLAGMASECQNLAKVVAKPCSKTVIAGVSQKGLWATDDSGKTWKPLGTGAGSATITNRSTSIVFDPQHPNTFWETGLFGDQKGLFTTTDGGQTFKQLGMSSMNQLVSVDFTDPERKTLVAGTHGQRQSVFRSKDGGQTFDNIGLTLAADVHNSESPIVLNSQTYLLGACGSGDGTCGIFRTTDGGKTWVSKSDLPVSHFGSPLWASDSAIYWPLLGDAGLAKSTDFGLTWTKIVEGGVLVGVQPAELPDHSLVAVGVDHLMRSKDGGTSWQPIGEPLPFKLMGTDQGSLAYSAQSKTFFLSQWDCNNAVLPNAIMSAGFDYEAL